MPLVQGGPPEWIWERTADPLKWNVVPAVREQQIVYEVRLDCGLGIIRLHFFTKEEIEKLSTAIAKRVS